MTSFEQLLRSLAEARVDFIVVGGIAGGLHGAARATYDLDGLQTYLRHPAHIELGARFGQSLSSALVYDFEVGGMEVLEKLASPH